MFNPLLALFSSVNMDDLMASFQIMGQGMLGIFVVLILIALIVTLLTKLTTLNLKKSAKQKGENNANQ